MTDYKTLINEARRAQAAVYLATHEDVAVDISRIIKGLADAVEELDGQVNDLLLERHDLSCDLGYANERIDDLLAIQDAMRTERNSTLLDIEAENVALRAQLDSMTIERPYVPYPGRVRQRLVGPWVEVTD